LKQHGSLALASPFIVAPLAFAFALAISRVVSHLVPPQSVKLAARQTRLAPLVATPLSQPLTLCASSQPFARTPPSAAARPFALELCVIFFIARLIVLIVIVLLVIVLLVIVGLDQIRSKLAAVE
jgi:hypothetical protein